MNAFTKRSANQTSAWKKAPQGVIGALNKVSSSSVNLRPTTSSIQKQG